MHHGTVYVYKLFLSPIEKIVNFQFLHAYFLPINQIISGLHQLFQPNRNIIWITLRLILRCLHEGFSVQLSHQSIYYHIIWLRVHVATLSAVTVHYGIAFPTIIYMQFFLRIWPKEGILGLKVIMLMMNFRNRLCIDPHLMIMIWNCTFPVLPVSNRTVCS